MVPDRGRWSSCPPLLPGSWITRQIYPEMRSGTLRPGLARWFDQRAAGVTKNEPLANDCVTQLLPVSRATIGSPSEPWP